MTKRVRVQTERRREQCRINQTRYHANQNATGLGLHTTVDKLQYEVQHGCNVGRPTARALDNAVTAAAAATYQDDVHVDDTRCGHTAVVEQWHCFSTLWGTLSVELCMIERVLMDDTSMTQPETMRVELTGTQTIEYVFPHLMLAHHLDLNRTLLGQRLVCDATVIHVFNTQSRILRAEWTVAVVAALLSYRLYHVDEVARIECDA